MKKISKKILSVIMAVAMVFTALATPDIAGLEFDGFEKTKTTTVKKADITGRSSNPVGIVPSDSELIYGDEDGLTKAEWMHNLAIVFDMSIEEDNCPDNYFTDIDSSYEYYYDIMLAIEFGVMDIPYGEAFEPEEIVTRQLAATTLNFCLGFEFDSEENDYTFSESTDEAYADYIDDFQIAIDRGWFALSDGKFLPDSAVTSDEAEGMLTDATQTLADEEIDTSVENEYVFADYVIDYTDDVTIEYVDDDTINIYDTKTALSVDDTFVVWNQGYPFIYTATAVAKKTSYITVDTTDAPDDAVVSMISSGELQADMSTFEPAEDVKVEYVETDSQAAYLSAEKGISVTSDSVVADTKITLANGLEVKITCSLKNLKFIHNIGVGYASAKITGNTELKAQFTSDVVAAAGSSSTICLGKIQYGPASVGVYITLDISGKIVAVYTGNFEAGIEYSGAKFRIIKSFNKKSFTISAEATVKLGIQAKADINLIVFKGDIYAETGIQAHLSANNYNDGIFPTYCEDFSAWIYAKIGASVSVFGKSFDKQYDVFDKWNSPFYLHMHFDEGNQVSQCKRKDNSNTSRYTSPSETKLGSRYQTDVSSESISGSVSSSENSQLWEYKLDNNRNAILAKYNGKSGVIVIPTTIDGYDVVTIGENAFSDNNYIKIVIISDVITSIKEYAFSNCKSISSVTLSNNLEELASDAFACCSELTSINIPKSLTNVGTFGAFGDSGLKYVEFEDNIKKIPPYLFLGAKKLKSITIPDTVVEIGEFAFTGCENLSEVVIPHSVTSIGDRAFLSCSALNSITLTSNVNKIDSFAFGYSVYTSYYVLTKNSNFKIYGTSNSAAEQYAIDNEMLFKLIKEPSLSTAKLSYKLMEKN